MTAWAIPGQFFWLQRKQTAVPLPEQTHDHRTVKRKALSDFWCIGALAWQHKTGSGWWLIVLKPLKTWLHGNSSRLCFNASRELMDHRHSCTCTEQTGKCTLSPLAMQTGGQSNIGGLLWVGEQQSCRTWGLRTSVRRALLDQTKGVMRKTCWNSIKRALDKFMEDVYYPGWLNNISRMSCSGPLNSSC